MSLKNYFLLISLLRTTEPSVFHVCTQVFQPALSYLVRLSLSLHVLDGVLDALHYQVPLSRLTWSTEIAASTVWQARELLGHLVEQRHALMEPTTIEQASSSSAHKQVYLKDVVYCCYSSKNFSCLIT